MAGVHDLVDVGACSQTGFRGTSNDFCILDIKRIKKILRSTPNFKFPADFDFTYANLLIEVQKGNITPLYKIVDNTYTTAENGVQTFGGGDKAQIEKMPIEMQGKMLNGVQGYKNTVTVESAKSHSFFLVDVDDTIFGFKGKDGLWGGINSDFFQVMPYVGAGDESAGYMIEWQLNRNQFDTGLAGLRSNEYDFEIDTIKGITNLEISIPVAPETGATAVAFKVVRDEDKVAQLGLDNTELEFKVNGVAVASPAVTDNLDGTYSVAVAALTLADKVSIRAWDGTYENVDLDGVLLKSNTAETITVAP